ncbi:6070_t:CDS:1, partial [Racocetra fulgida]
MDSQEEYSSSFQKSIYTDESDSENNSNDTFSTTSTTTNTSTKKKRNKGRKSFVWKYFKKIGNKDICDVEIKKNGKDQKCGTEYTHDGSTSNMIAHLKSAHNIVDSKKLKPKVQKNRQTTISESIQLNTLYKDDKLKEINRAVIEWILIDNKPLSALRKKGFCHMIAKIDPKFRLPSDRV